MLFTYLEDTEQDILGKFDVECFLSEPCNTTFSIHMLNLNLKYTNTMVQAHIVRWGPSHKINNNKHNIDSTEN